MCWRIAAEKECLSPQGVRLFFQDAPPALNQRRGLVAQLRKTEAHDSAQRSAPRAGQPQQAHSLVQAGT